METKIASFVTWRLNVGGRPCNYKISGIKKGFGEIAIIRETGKREERNYSSFTPNCQIKSTILAFIN